MADPLRVLACGGRDFDDRAAVRAALDAIRLERGIAVLIHGAALGADSLAAEWAADNGIDALAFPAEWKLHGRAAGPIRNQRMVDEARPDLVVAFAGGRGTADMAARARRAGIEVREVGNG